MDSNFEKHSSKIKNCLSIYSIPSSFSLFHRFHELIFYIKFTYFYRAQNSTLNDMFILFFKWILIMKNTRQRWRIVFDYITFHVCFLFSSNFCKSIFSIRMTYSFRALNSLSNDVFKQFFQWILSLKKKRQRWGIVFDYVTFHFCFLFSPDYMNQLSPLKLHILIEHWILHGMIYLSCFFSGF